MQMFLVYYDKIDYPVPNTPYQSWFIYTDNKQRAIELISLHHDIPYHHLDAKELNIYRMS
jgi:hypothetical protein